MTVDSICPTCQRPLDASPIVYQDSLLTFMLYGRDVRMRSRKVALTRIESDLLSALIQCRDQVVSIEGLVVWVWGPEYADAKYLAKWHIANLRRKLGITKSGIGPIKTVRGFGYTYEVPKGKGRVIKEEEGGVMTPEEHLKAAERLLEHSESPTMQSMEYKGVLAQQALAHANLAMGIMYVHQNLGVPISPPERN